MRPGRSLPPDYFEYMFRDDPDPWKFQTSPYEACKYNATLGALESRIYDSALEIGCANGVLSQRLAKHCRKLMAVDVSPSALARARLRCSDATNVAFEVMSFPAQQPAGTFDLIVLSEVIYYWNRSDIARTGRFVGNRLSRSGDLLLVHWTGETDYPHSGDDAVHLLRDALPELIALRADRTENYRLDLWRKL